MHAGIGNAIATELADKGYHVFAGVRRQASLDAWKRVNSPNITPIMLDVTDPSDIQAVVKQVEKEREKRGAKLAGLIGNAGQCTLMMFHVFDVFRFLFPRPPPERILLFKALALGSAEEKRDAREQRPQIKCAHQYSCSSTKLVHIQASATTCPSSTTT